MEEAIRPQTSILFTHSFVDFHFYFFKLLRFDAKQNQLSDESDSELVLRLSTSASSACLFMHARSNGNMML